jgi:hypothetical protein
MLAQEVYETVEQITITKHIKTTEHNGDVTSSDEEFIPCELCDEDHMAYMRCMDCMQNMCETAAKLHSRTKSTKNHRLVLLSNLDENSSCNHGEIFCLVCPTHNDTYRYFDRDCGCVICRDCFALNHTGHKCVNSAVAAKEFRETLDKSSKDVRLRIDSLVQAEKSIEEIAKNLNNNYTALNEKLESTFEKLYNHLIARHKELQVELHNLYYAKANHLTEQRDKLVHNRTNWEEYLSSADRALKMDVEKVTDVNTFDSLSTEFILHYQKLEKDMKKMENKPQPTLDSEVDETMELRIPENDFENLINRLITIGVVSDGKASANKSVAEGEDLTVCVHKKKEEPMVGSFKVKAYDNLGHIKKRGGDEIKVILKEVDPKKKKVIGEAIDEKSFTYNVIDHNNGSYTVTYQVLNDALTGEKELSVFLNDEAIQSSPFRMMFVRKYRLDAGVPEGPNLTDSSGIVNTKTFYEVSDNQSLAPVANRLLAGSNMDISKDGTRAVANLNVAFCKLQAPLNECPKITIRRSKGANPDIGYCDVAIFDTPNPSSTFAANGNIQGARIFWRIWNGEFYFNGKLVSTNPAGKYQGDSSYKFTVQYNINKVMFYMNETLVHSFNVSSTELLYLYVRPYYQHSTIELLP